MKPRTVMCMIEVESTAPLKEIRNKTNWEFWCPQHDSAIKGIRVDVADATKTHRRPAK